MTQKSADTLVTARRVFRRATGRDERRASGHFYVPVLALAGIGFCAVFVALVTNTALEASQAFSHSGIGFFWSGVWNPAAGSYGAGLLVVDTVVTTGLALLIVVPVGLATAIALAETLPSRIAAPLAAAIELLAAVPTIVVGLWGLIVLSPLFARDVEPFFRAIPLVGAAFSGPAYGPGLLLAGAVLSVTIFPTMVALSRTALRTVPTTDRDAALALGATRWQVVRRVTVPGARSGIAAAITLAAGRAFGESIAVAMVIGNSPSLPHSLSATGATLGSAIVTQFAEATTGLGTSSIVALAVVLLVLTLLVNLGGRALLHLRWPDFEHGGLRSLLATRGAVR